MSSDKQVSSSVDEKPSTSSAASAPGGAAPSNKDLAEAVKDLGKMLGEDVVTTGLSKVKLVEKLEELKAKLAARESRSGEPASSTADDKPSSAAPAPAAEPKTGPRYYVAERRSVTTKRGLISAGERIEPRDVSGGEERLEHLASRGVLVKR